MLAVAAEMNLSETAFVVVDHAIDQLPLRWFTPRVEVDLCWHATLATAHVLWESAARSPESRRVRHLERRAHLHRRPRRDNLDVLPRPALGGDRGTQDWQPRWARCAWRATVTITSLELADAATVRALTPGPGRARAPRDACGRRDRRGRRRK
jgi:hypothetical protein